MEILNTNFTQIEEGITKIFKGKSKKYKKGELITNYLEKRNQICLLIEGEADLIRYDFGGNKVIVEHYSANSMFGEAFYSVNTSNELIAIAKKECTVIFFNFNDIISNTLPKNQLYYDLVTNLLLTFSSKIVEMNDRTQILSKRTIREKLLSYFQMMTSNKFSKSFLLPFSLNDLADYLSIDRCAMMRELKNLKEEGFIKKEGKRISLLY